MASTQLKTNLSYDDVTSIYQTANDMGVDPYSLGALIELESNFRPNVMGGAGGRYKGLIQMGPGARSEVGLPDVDMTVAEQMPYVSKYMFGRGFKPGMGVTEMYRTVLVGNPWQSGTDSFGTNSDSAAQRMLPGGDLYQRAKSKMELASGSGNTIGMPGAAFGATNSNAVSPGDLSGVFDASFPGRDLPAYEDDPRFAAAKPFIAGVEKIFGTPSQQAKLSSGLSATNNVPLAGDTRTIAIGKHLVDQGYTPWQHTNFDVNKGYIDQGGARVWQRPYESDHNTAEGALDFPLSHNTPEQLATLNNYLDQNREALGVKQLIWGVPGHKDHLHVAFHPQVTRRRIS